MQLQAIKRVGVAILAHPLNSADIDFATNAGDVAMDVFLNQATGNVCRALAFYQIHSSPLSKKWSCFES